MPIIYPNAVQSKYLPSYRLLDGKLAALFHSPDTMLNSNVPAFGPDTHWQAGLHHYREAAPLAVAPHVTTAGGAKLFVQPDTDGTYNFVAFGADTSGTVEIDSLMKKVLGLLPTGSTLRMPKGTYKKGGTGGGNQIVIPEGIHVVGEPGTRIVSSSYPIFRTSGRNRIEGLTFDNSNGGVSIGIEIFGDDNVIRYNHFHRGNQQIYLYDSNRTDVHDNVFEETGYSVLQKAGYSSNAVRVSRNRFLRCTGDCVELNSEINNPSWGWQITDNYAKDTGGENPTAVATEDRFFGATATRAVLIKGNLVDGVAGDSALHFENLAGDTIVTGNIFRDVHGGSGKLLFATSSLDDCTIDFSHNQVEFSEDYGLLSGETSTLVYQLGGDRAFIRLSDNTFRNYSSESLTIHAMSNSSRGTDFTGNRVENFDTGIMAGTGGSANHPIRVQRNTFTATQCPVRMSPSLSTTAYSVFIDENTFVDCPNVWASTTSGAIPHSLSHNICQGTTTIDEATIIGLGGATRRVQDNRVRAGATTTRADYQSYVGGAGAKELFDLATAPGGYPTAILNIRTTDGTSSSGNATSQTVLLQRISASLVTLTVLGAGTSGGGASFLLSVSGTKLLGASSADRRVEVSVPGPDYTSHTPSLA